MESGNDGRTSLDMHAEWPVGGDGFAVWMGCSLAPLLSNRLLHWLVDTRGVCVSALAGVDGRTVCAMSQSSSWCSTFPCVEIVLKGYSMISGLISSPPIALLCWLRAVRMCSISM